MRQFISIILLLIPVTIHAQEDTTRQLKPVVIEAYQTRRLLLEVPVAVNLVSTSDIERFNPVSILPAVNVAPGVRMEERSPGSYRFAIRGSSLRSPFGVRNVKFYWNNLPLTDGGGNTYLNLIDPSAIGSMEIIKGPGGSLYGSGTGGVVLLKSPQVTHDQLSVSSIIGSYGLSRTDVAGQLHNENFNMRLAFSHQNYDGYREQSTLQRTTLNNEFNFRLAEETYLTTTLLLSKLYYETPGGLTKSEFETSAKSARPAAGINRGAVEQQAAVSNETIFGGITLDHQWSDQWSSRLSLLSSYTDFRNPAIRNVEERFETNLGARNENVFTFSKQRIKGTWSTGFEFQQYKSPIRTYENNYGIKGNVFTSDDLTSASLAVFSQLQLDLPLNFLFTVGGSVNHNQVRFEREYPDEVNESVDFDLFISPRVALLNKITPGISVYTSVSRGFSSPSLAELFPSRAVFDKSIKPETGTNFELGLRANHKKEKLSLDVTIYNFQLDNTLVVRRDEDGADYFVNAGNTIQKGIESKITWNALENVNNVISDVKLANAFTYQYYRFQNYIQADQNYSGNKLTGVPPNLNVTTLDIVFKKKFYVNITGSYTDHIPLNDANTFYASEYFLVGSRLGYRQSLSSMTVDAFLGGDNLLNKKYSLGNDLNAFGGRFYNTAPGVNFYLGAKVSFTKH